MCKSVTKCAFRWYFVGSGVRRIDRKVKKIKIVVDGAYFMELQGRTGDHKEGMSPY